MPYNPDKIDLKAIPSRFSRDSEVGSPIQVTCSPCTVQDVELHPRVKSGIIPKISGSGVAYQHCSTS